jgi:hypothetical protein
MTAEQFCDRCGTPVSPTAAFCGSCGQPVARAAQPAPPRSVPQPPPAPPAWGGDSVPSQPPQSYAQGSYPTGYGAPPQYPTGAPYAPPVAPARPGVQLPPLGQLAKQADVIAIAGGVLLALAIVLPVYGGSNPLNGFTLLSSSVWTLIEPVVLAAGPIAIGFLLRQRQLGVMLSMGAILALGAVGTAQFAGYFLDGLLRGGISSWGIGSLVGAVGGVAVLVAGISLARQNPIR